MGMDGFGTTYMDGDICAGAKVNQHMWQQNMATFTRGHIFKTVFDSLLEKKLMSLGDVS